MIKEFKPAIFFVLKFLAIYFVGNILYGLYVESYDQIADPVTTWVTEQSVGILNISGQQTEAFKGSTDPKVYIKNTGQTVLSVYEGCNGLNVIIIFVAFLVAYGGKAKDFLWFIPLGILSIHLANLARIILLYFVVRYYPDYMYFTHKFLFTGFIYAFVLLLWYIWVSKLNK